CRDPSLRGERLHKRSPRRLGSRRHRGGEHMRGSFRAITVAILLLPGCGGPSGGAGPAVGQVAPDFTGKTLDGATFHLADFRGQVVVLDFWATWCPPCRAMIPHEREMLERLAGKPFALVSISVDSDESALRD